MLDFTAIPVIDNHSHPFELDQNSSTPDSLARLFFHGMGDIPKVGVKKARRWGASDDLRHHIRNMGVAQTLICQLSQLFGCPPEARLFVYPNRFTPCRISLASACGRDGPHLSPRLGGHELDHPLDLPAPGRVLSRRDRHRSFVQSDCRKRRT